MAAEQLLTVAKLAERLGVSKASLGKQLKDKKVQPDLVKANCSYYSLTRIEMMRDKLGV